MKTGSPWGKSPAFLYHLLNRAELCTDDRPLKLAVLRCSDGRYVLPAARRAWDVLAIDMGSTSIHGGPESPPSGDAYTPGPLSKMVKERLSNNAMVICGDFMDAPAAADGHLVISSGALEHGHNQQRDNIAMLLRIGAHLKKGGVLVCAVCCTLDSSHSARSNCVPFHAWSQMLEVTGCDILYHYACSPAFERGRVGNPGDHFHQLGHFLTRV